MLQALCAGWQEIVVQLMLNKGVDVSGQSGEDGSALLVAMHRAYTTADRLGYEWH
jgi:hypothetical protein